MIRVVVLLFLFSGTLLANSDISVMTIYNRTNFIDEASSSQRYDADVFGLRFGGNSYYGNLQNIVDMDLSVGISSRKGQDFFADMPFYVNARLAYTLLIGMVKITDHFLIGLGPGLEYNLDGTVPTNLYGSGLSWIQTISLTLSLYSDIKLQDGKLIRLTLFSPFAGILNRPDWTGVVSKEIESLSKTSYLDVLINRGQFYTLLDYISVSFSILYKAELSEDITLYIEEVLNYSATEIPRSYGRISGKFIFGIKIKTLDF